MQEKTPQLNLAAAVILTGFAFVIGGLFKTLLELYLINSENFWLIFTAIWFGFLAQSAIGMAVLAFLLRRHYSFRKLWLAGTGAFALGILFPALLMNQFFYALLFLPGLLVTMFFRMFLNERSKQESLLFMITLGFLICQVMILIVQNDIPWSKWLNENFGPSGVIFFMHMVIDAVIGFFVALGVGLMVRWDKKANAPHAGGAE